MLRSTFSNGCSTRPTGNIELPGVGVFDWPVVVALLDALLGVDGSTPKPQNRARLFAPVEDDLAMRRSAQPTMDNCPDDPADHSSGYAVSSFARIQRIAGRLADAALAIPARTRERSKPFCLALFPTSSTAPIADGGAHGSTIPETGDELRAMAMREPLPYRRHA